PREHVSATKVEPPGNACRSPARARTRRSGAAAAIMGQRVARVAGGDDGTARLATSFRPLGVGSRPRLNGRWTPHDVPRIPPMRIRPRSPFLLFAAVVLALLAAPAA